jgi:hypothetical protein
LVIWETLRTMEEGRYYGNSRNPIHLCLIYMLWSMWHKKTATVLDSARQVIVQTHTNDTMHTKRGPALKQADALNELHRTLLSCAAPYFGQRHILSELRRSLVS